MTGLSGDQEAPRDGLAQAIAQVKRVREHFLHRSEDSLLPILNS